RASSLLCLSRPPPRSTLFPYTTLFRSGKAPPRAPRAAHSKARREHCSPLVRNADRETAPPVVRWRAHLNPASARLAAFDGVGRSAFLHTTDYFLFLRIAGHFGFGFIRESKLQRERQPVAVSFNRFNGGLDRVLCKRMSFDFEPRRAFLQPLVQVGRKTERHWVCVLWHVEDRLALRS